ncbi:MAG: YihY/virulence factor BrkB family protein, partial [Chlamydiota bacterium]
MVQKLHKFLKDELWNFPLSQEKGWRYTRFKWLRIAYLAIRGFHQDKCTLIASSLTYYTLMSIVPVLAMFFAIARGFGYQEHLRQDLLAKFQDHSRVLLEVFSFAEKLLEETKGGVIAGIGLAILFWSITQLLSNMESALNQIWGIKKMRSWKRIVSDYFSLMLIAPFLFILSGSMTVFVVGELETLLRTLALAPWAISSLLFFVRLIPYGLYWVLFSFIYLFMPNTKVHLRSA